MGTSALIKLYVAETGTQEVMDAVGRSDKVFTHLIAYAETFTALSRLQRMGCLTAEDLERRLDRFDSDWPNLAVVQVDDAMVRDAGRMAYLYGLRGYDSVHLAAARFLQHKLDGPLSFACFDRRLNLAAANLGMLTLPNPA